MQSSSSSSPSTPRLYFAYGSNLSLSQMSLRCPTATYHSLAVLRGWKWIIGTRGYANIVYTSIRRDDERGKDGGKEMKGGGEEGGDRVYGILYVLQEEDESALDIAEGVPSAYEKVDLGVEMLSEEEEGKDAKGGGEVKVLVYVDLKRAGEGVCRDEYVARMNRGIRDAIKKGLPQSYVDGVLRKWVRDEEIPGDGEIKDPFL
ncbi:uncharacterized protein RSE6_06714 [Rhynchosporium secalis]|uniref:gamma-glutamylcyclotransferase n=1 Tax=Rhynchosporium secalis TaxID=38038 RepID=A0A1E1MB58_RHYSE|nr:uncharacterized protein RSE6_06714 [Rhynchosporium secalis]